MPTPEETRREIEALRRRADRLESEAKAREALAARLRSLSAADLPVLQGELEVILAEVRLLLSRSALTSPKDTTILATVESISTAETRGLARGRGRSKALKDKHPFVVALYKEGKTVASWARENGIPYATAASWVSRGKSAKRIPRATADKIEKQFGVPATQRTWARGENKGITE